MFLPELGVVAEGVGAAALLLLTPRPSSPSLSLSRLLALALFFFNDTAHTEIYTLSLHDALPISYHREPRGPGRSGTTAFRALVPPVSPSGRRSEEHTSELQSRFDLVCRLLL